MNCSVVARRFTAAILAAGICLPCLAQEKKPEEKKGGKATPSEADMTAMMMDMMKTGENHKLLAQNVGTWTATVKMWMMDPNGPPTESTATTVITELMGGRYFKSEHTGKMPMPGPDGKMTDMEFKGLAIDGYDNVKHKFVSTWIDNMGTGILISEGDYDPATKTFTYRTEEEMMPGMKVKVREVLKMTDKDHHTFEWYEERGGTEVKTLEIVYTRKK